MVQPVCRTQSEHLPAPLLHPVLPEMPAQEVPGSESKGTEPPVPSETPPTPGRVCFGAAIDMDLETYVSPSHVDLHSWCHKQLLPHAIGTSTCTPNLISVAVYGTDTPDTSSPCSFHVPGSAWSERDRSCKSKIWVVLQALLMLILQLSCFPGTIPAEMGRLFPEVVPNILPKRVSWLLADKGTCEITSSIWKLVIVNTRRGSESSKREGKKKEKKYSKLHWQFCNWSPASAPLKRSRFVPMKGHAAWWEKQAWAGAPKHRAAGKLKILSTSSWGWVCYNSVASPGNHTQVWEINLFTLGISEQEILWFWYEAASSV